MIRHDMFSAPGGGIGAQTERNISISRGGNRRVGGEQTDALSSLDDDHSGHRAAQRPRRSRPGRRPLIIDERFVIRATREERIRKFGDFESLLPVCL